MIFTTILWNHRGDHYEFTLWDRHVKPGEFRVAYKPSYNASTSGYQQLENKILEIRHEGVVDESRQSPDLGMLPDDDAIDSLCCYLDCIAFDQAALDKVNPDSYPDEVRCILESYRAALEQAQSMIPGWCDPVDAEDLDDMEPAETQSDVQLPADGDDEAIETIIAGYM